jgi:hypothetical protein
MLEGLQKMSEDISLLAITVVANEWRAQGHELSGSAVKQMETVIREEIASIIIEGYIPDYMAINNSGVTAARIPYTPNSGRPPS